MTVARLLPYALNVRMPGGMTAFLFDAAHDDDAQRKVVDLLALRHDISPASLMFIVRPDATRMVIRRVRPAERQAA